MRLTRKQLALMYEATKDTAAEEFYLDVQADGKLSFGAYEVIEKRRPIGLTNLASKAKRERVSA